MKEICAANETAVGYVDGTWMIGIGIFVMIILVLSSQEISKQLDPKINDSLMIGALGALVIFVVYPYLHYRIQGGKFARIPPRYQQNKPYMAA